ncbi:MAG: transglycosylase domain-containing protein [Ilumatobacteraceae bacterium]
MGRFSWVFRLGLVIGAGSLLTTAVVVAVAPRLWRIANAHEEVPVELPEFEPLAQRTYVYDTEGNEIAVYELENSQPVTLDQVPSDITDAFLAVEDNEFWVHKGVNMRSLFRATLSNFASDAPQQGASTITMQVVKNDFLAGLERDGRYKLLQMVYAMRLEKQISKQEILQRYLNTVFFGNNAYGIAAAAEIYFGKQVAELTFIEAAFLAGLVRSPSGYDPINNPERSRARFVQVLDRLVDDGALTEVEATEVLDTFVIPERVKSIPTRATERTYYTEALREYLLNESNLLGETYEERYNKLFRGGLRIHTTLNPFLQSEAERARDVLPDTLQGFDAAIVSLDTKTAAIRAMVGGRGFEPGRNEVNLALSPSQTGSSIKIFILAAALQAGAEPDDLIDGTRGCRLPSDDPNNPIFEITGGIAGGIFTLREQTYRSVNCAFARLSQIVGLNRVVDTTYRMASSTYLYRGQPVEERLPIEPFASFATGANEMSTLDMAAGMQTIANVGVHETPYYVDYIDDAAGNRVYTHASSGERVLDKDVALTQISLMKDVLTRGTARQELSDFAALRPAAGKTGTQQSNYTAFFVGATPFLSTAVLVRDPARYTPMEGIPEFVAEGVPNVQGGTFPARIWGAYMEQAHVFEPVTDWADPPELTRPPARLYLPGVECLFRAVVTTVPTDSVPASSTPEAPDGDVTEQAPPPTAPPTTAPETTAPPTGTTVPAVPTATTAPPRPVYTPIDSGTTIPPDELDPRAPLPSTPRSVYVAPCR